MKDILNTRLTLLLITLALGVGTALGQQAPAPKSVRTPLEPPDRLEFPGRGATSEKSLVVDPMLNVSLCVSQGSLKVRGWNRGELRVFIRNGSRYNFAVQEKNAAETPSSVIISGLDPARGTSGPPNECIWGDDIEVDVPNGTIVNLKGREAIAAIDTVRKVRIKVVGGDIAVRGISEGVSIFAGQGDITVEDSKGSMQLESTTGNIVVFEGSPRETGDIFRAKTNGGTISLQQVEYRQVEVNSVSGSVVFTGKVLNGGSYAFTTSNGAIRLAIPLESAGRLAATYGFGSFNSEIPVNVVTNDVRPGGVQSMNGTFGKDGNATVRLTTSSGSINIRKQP